MMKVDSIHMYQQRRAALLENLPDNSLALCFAAKVRYRNHDTEYPYRQHSDFYYLTGFNEPNAILALRKTTQGVSVMIFNQVRDASQEVWTGKRLGQDNACELLGVDEAHAIDTFDEHLPRLLTDCDHFFYTTSQCMKTDRRILYTLDSLRQKSRSGVRVPHSVHDFSHEVARLRIIKSQSEIALMQQAVDMSVQAHKRAMRVCEPGMKEYALEAEIMHTFLKWGARSPAYGNIVAGGANACVLHYVENTATLKSGDLVLIDAGAEYNNYAADITRTFPVDATFTGPQKAIYELVLEAQTKAIEKIKPGTPWPDLQTCIVKILTQGLVDLNILQGEVEGLIEQKAYQTFYMHNSGHWLGLDVHDVGDYKQGDEWCQLAENMALTVEPGLYIAPSETVDETWWNIGVHIEDDIVVTQTGANVLSGDLPRTVADIEMICAGK